MNSFSAILRVAVSGVMLLTASPFSQAQTKLKPVSSEQSCKAYVKRFYAWYVQAMLHPGNKIMSDVAIDRKDFAFSPELRKAFKDDLAASRKNKGEVVGLDFDPFLNAQDPSERYVVGKVTVTNGQCAAEIHSVDAGKQSEKPDVVAKLGDGGGQWVFTNFVYPQVEKDGDLLSILKALRDEREAHR